MPLGDSITHGYPSTAGYRSHLWYKLKDANFPVDFVGSLSDGSNVTPFFDSDHEGYDGWKTYDISEVVYGLLENNQPDVILLHIGSNDVSPTQGLNSSSILGLKEILNQIDSYEKNYNHPIKVILAKIINRSRFHTTVVYFNLNLYNMAVDRVHSGDDITVVDMEHDAGLTSSDFADATHPNNSGYSKMATVWFESLKLILPTLMTENPFIEPFVQRFYQTILLREGETSGVENWVNGLSNCQLSAADLARGFIFSDEFIMQENNHTVFLEILYRAFFNREPDTTGLSYWEKELSEGKSQFNVLNGFLYSQEFNLLATSYNILSVDPAEYFVKRFYVKVLEREADKDGFLDWVSKLRSQTINAREIAKSFFFSEEYINKNVNNETYLLTLYRTLLDREADLGGLSRWVQKLEEGLSREVVLDSFIQSPEFKNLSKSYNIRL